MCAWTPSSTCTRPSHATARCVRLCVCSRVAVCARVHCAVKCAMLLCAAVWPQRCVAWCMDVWIETWVAIASAP